MLLIRRLAYGPGLLAGCLLLGWAGEAEADFIWLTVDKGRVREDAGKTEITVTATNYDALPFPPFNGQKKAVSKDTHVLLTLPTYQRGLNRFFRVELTTILIPKDKDAASGTIILTPIDNELKGSNTADNGTHDDHDIRITAKAGAGYSARDIIEARIRVPDNDKRSTQVRFSLDPAEVSKEAGPTPIEVTATLNGKTLSKDLSFPLVVGGGTAERDADYELQLSTLTIPRGKPEGKTTITFTPKDEGTGTLRLAGTPGVMIVSRGLDLNRDGDAKDTLDISTHPLREVYLGFDFTGEGNFSSSLTSLNETIRNVDLNDDGDATDAALTR